MFVAKGGQHHYYYVMDSHKYIKEKASYTCINP